MTGRDETRAANAAAESDAPAGLLEDASEWFQGRRPEMGMHLYSGDLWTGVVTESDYEDEETELLARTANDIGSLVGEGATFVSLGPGNGNVVKHEDLVLIAAMDAPRGYVAVDVDPGAIDSSLREVSKAQPNLHTEGVRADLFALCEPLGAERAALVSCLGGTIGNLPVAPLGNQIPELAFVELIKNWKRVSGPRGTLLVSFREPLDHEQELLRYQAKASGDFCLSLLHRIASCPGAALDPETFRYMPLHLELASGAPEGSASVIEVGVQATAQQVIQMDGTEIPISTGQRFVAIRSYRIGLALFEQWLELAGLKLLFTAASGPQRLCLIGSA